MESPKIQPIEGSGYVRLTETYRIAISDDVLLIIKEGWEFDGASIPAIVWPLFGHPLSSFNLPPATAHDALYSAHYISRAAADRVFYRLLIANGKSPIKAALMYLAVRIGGAFVWSKRKAQIAREREWITFEVIA